MTDFVTKYNVRVIPHSRQNKVVESDGVLRVYTTVAPEKGNANKAVVELLADYFGVPKSRVQILKGLTFREKTVAVF